jgi:hypothetical protein
MSQLESAALHKTALAALERADMALAHAQELKIDGPWRASDISAATLEAMLGAPPGAKIDSAALSQAHDGMTARNKWSLR